MRNHSYVELIAQTLLTYNNEEYIYDINQIINNDDYNIDINRYLYRIINILQNHLEIINNHSTNISNIQIIKNSLKKNIFKILEENNGRHCCNRLLAIELN